MLKLDNNAKCCGCSACASICPHGAIKMVPDSLGFVYPSINLELCVKCGLCEKVCAFNENSISKNNDPLYSFAVRNKDVLEVENSRSGAAFVAFSNIILDRQGVIYGAVLTRDLHVKHQRAISRFERDLFRGSKYVQSDISGIFIKVADDLNNGMNVLFSGTPCQVAGLKSYLLLRRIDCTNLFLLDLICHGVPSPYYWRDYISYIESKEHSKVIKVDFRDKKRYGWSAHRESFEFENGTIKSYYHSFYHDIMLRCSCSECPYANVKRISDITIGDFWGWERVSDNINSDDKGVNLVLINSKKGQQLFNEIKSDVIFIQANIEQIIQPNLLAPTKAHPLRSCFEQDYIKYGFKYVGRKYIGIGLRWKLLQIKKMIYNFLADIL